MLAKLRRTLAEHSARLADLRPIRSPGTVTSLTTRGVSRRVKVAQRGGATIAASNKPRWG